MPESLARIAKDATKEAKYRQILDEIKSLVAHENDLIANLANISAVLKEIFAFWWVGFYLVKDNQLVLGPFQVRYRLVDLSSSCACLRGSTGVYKNSVKQGSLRRQLGSTANNRRGKCASISWSYRWGNQKGRCFSVTIIPAVFLLLACSSASLSEIVVPIVRVCANDGEGQVMGVLDVDSEHEAHFDDVDRYYLEELVRECVAPCFT